MSMRARETHSEREGGQEADLVRGAECRRGPARGGRRRRRSLRRAEDQVSCGDDMWKLVVGTERSGRPAVLPGGRSMGAESTAAAAGEADAALRPPPAVEGGRAEEESEEPFDDEAEACCSGNQRVESVIIRSCSHHSKM